MLKNIDNQATNGEEKSKPEVIQLGLDLHARQVTECRQLVNSSTGRFTPKSRQLYDAMLELYPDRVNPGSLWGAANTAKKQA